jgi:hypothetical protein
MARLTDGLEGCPVEQVVDPKASFVTQPIQLFSQRSDFPLPFGPDQQTDDAGLGQPIDFGGRAGLRLIQQDDIRFLLYCQRDRFRFAVVQIAGKRFNERSVVHDQDSQPALLGSFLDFGGAGPSPSLFDDLAPDSRGNLNLVEKCSQQMKTADRREMNQRGGIAKAL